MKLRSLKAHFKINALIEYENQTKHKNFKLEDATFTVYAHTKNVLHVSGVKSLFHLEQCELALKKKYEIVYMKIYNRLYSHKDSKSINMKNLYDHLCQKQKNEKFNTIYEPELFPGLMRSSIRINPYQQQSYLEQDLTILWVEILKIYAIYKHL